MKDIGVRLARQCQQALNVRNVGGTEVREFAVGAAIVLALRQA